MENKNKEFIYGTSGRTTPLPPIEILSPNMKWLEKIILFLDKIYCKINGLD